MYFGPSCVAATYGLEQLLSDFFNSIQSGRYLVQLRSLVGYLFEWPLHKGNSLRQGLFSFNVYTDRVSKEIHCSLPKLCIYSYFHFHKIYILECIIHSNKISNKIIDTQGSLNDCLQFSFIPEHVYLV